MKVRSGDVSRDGAILIVTLFDKEWIYGPEVIGPADMDFIAGDFRTQKRAPRGLNGDLVPFEASLNRKQVQSNFRAPFFRAEWIRHSTSQHLIAAANSQHPPAVL